MKSKILLLATAFFMAMNIQAQAPEKFNYQGIARDNTGAPLANQNLGIQISILNPANNPLYVERHTVTTNDFGLYTLVIGDGNPQSGTMAGVNWAGNTKKIKVEIDPNGGTNYTSLGTTELLSVPYALYAGKSASTGWKLNGNAVGNNDFIGTTNNEDLRFKVNNLNAGIITFGSPYNTAFGQETLGFNTSGLYNVAVGYQAFFANTSGSSNTSIGYQALNANTTGDYNTAVGTVSLWDNTTGFGNTAVGRRSLSSNTTGDKNTAVGNRALESNTTASGNTAIGKQALTSNTAGRNNVAVGTNALFNNTTADYNNAIGEGALYANTTGHDNVGLGRKALGGNTTGDDNTAIGNLALNDNTTGGTNTAVGANSLDSNTTGIFNTAVGGSAMGDNTTGDYNVAVGIDAMRTTSGNADSNTAIGGYTRISDNSSNSIALGYDANVNGSNEAVIGNAVTTSIGGFVSYSNLSDARFKKQKKPLEHGLDFIMKLEPITYHYNMQKLNSFLDRREGESEEPTPEWMNEAMTAKAAIQYTGFSAQQVEAAAQSVGYDFSGVHEPNNALDHYSLAYAEFVVPLVKAIQEQQKTIEKLQQKIAELERKIEK